MSRLTDEEKNRLAAAVGGLRRYNQLKILVSDTTRLEEIYNKVKKAGNEITDDAIRAQQTLQSTIQRTKEEWFALWESKGLQTTLQQVIQLGGQLTQILPAIAAIGAIKGGALPPRS